MTMKIKYILMTGFFAMAVSSCGDMLDTDSNSQIIDPQLNEKSDSITYMLGIMKSVQQAADQYAITGELRGDLVKTNANTETDLKQLAEFSVSASTVNKYDSATVYYRIINNCNYFITYRDTTLVTSSRKVAMTEYAEAHAVRLWAYMQLAKNYGSVPFFTQPITTITDLEKDYPRKNLEQIRDILVPAMAKYSGTSVPSYGNLSNVSTTIPSNKIMIPIDVVIGDVYLETNQYEQAAKYYFNYLKMSSVVTSSSVATTQKYPNIVDLPTEIQSNTTSDTWAKLFSDVSSSVNEIVTMVPMTLNKLGGVTTSLPKYYGYDLYAVSSDETDKYLIDRQLEPSDAYTALACGQNYYYFISNGTVGSAQIGDMRYYDELTSAVDNNVSFKIVNKFNKGFVMLYRTSTVYLRLAEALNRMGYPDAAFAILKDGLSETTMKNNNYITPGTKDMLTNGVAPFFNNSNLSVFAKNSGIHSQGCGYTQGLYSPYAMDSIVKNKLSEISSAFGVEVKNTKNDTINAVEDLICDEYALETAFEGNRFGDLCRIANHKNADLQYGENFGGKWLGKKLAFKNAALEEKLIDKNNWYLPFK